VNSIRHYIDLIEGAEDSDGAIGETVTLLDLYEPSELLDPSEMLHDYAPRADWKKPLKVKQMTPAQAKSFRSAASDLTVVDTFKAHATKSQRKLVRDKAERYDHSRIIVVCHDAVIDGNHHLVAGLRAKQPIRYVDLGEID
jgi:hypothetical protein